MDLANLGETEVPKITFVSPDGTHEDVDAAEGESVMLAALLGSIDGIEAECGGACSCGTCVVEVASEWLNQIGKPNDLEAEMLAAIPSTTPASRLSCQIKIESATDGLVVHVP